MKLPSIFSKNECIIKTVNMYSVMIAVNIENWDESDDKQ